ncbi:hypothetical protein Glove_155g52 [Diversispora epigaea]|uniref:Uncharacterized protein n=1 Tax=Diversispora epigaea TaxID=1348612 RepID=A0A397IV52_9GLOM|nr:hypothetical protein Glove_155g52 [Diversispora epigaea]
MYDNNFQNIEHISDGDRESLYSAAELKNGIKWKRNFIKQDWRYRLTGYKVALKEIKEDIVEFLKVIKTVKSNESISIYILWNFKKSFYTKLMDSFDDDLHNFLTKTFWDLVWETKLDILLSIA